MVIHANDKFTSDEQEKFLMYLNGEISFESLQEAEQANLPNDEDELCKGVQFEFDIHCEICGVCIAMILAYWDYKYPGDTVCRACVSRKELEYWIRRKW